MRTRQLPLWQKESSGVVRSSDGAARFHWVACETTDEEHRGASKARAEVSEQTGANVEERWRGSCVSSTWFSQLFATAVKLRQFVILGFIEAVEHFGNMAFSAL